MTDLKFENPWWLLLFILLPMALMIQYYFRTKIKAIKTPSMAAFRGDVSWITQIKPILSILRIIALSLLIIALARPQKVQRNVEIISKQGIDIMLVVDVSLSMMSQDFEPNRLEKLKEVATNFVLNRPADRIGLVAFSGEGITKVPQTLDHSVLMDEIDLLSINELIDGTAIGVGLATAVNQLKESNAKSKVVILLTDGGEDPNWSISDINFTYISPDEASDMAKIHNLKVYTVGVASKGRTLLAIGQYATGEIAYRMGYTNIDEPLLESIAQNTGGKYFRATNGKALENIYQSINQLEKSDFEENVSYNKTDYFKSIVLWALALFMIEMLLRITIFRTATV